MARWTGRVSSNFSLSEYAGTPLNTLPLSSDFKSTNINSNAEDGGPISPSVRHVAVGDIVYTRTTLYNPGLPRTRTSSPTLGSKFKSAIANPPPFEAILPPKQIQTAPKTYALELPYLFDVTIKISFHFDHRVAAKLLVRKPGNGECDHGLSRNARGRNDTNV